MELWQPARTGQRAAASRAAPTRCRRSVSVSVVGVDFERLLMEASPDSHVGAPREELVSARFERLAGAMLWESGRERPRPAEQGVKGCLLYTSDAADDL